MGGSSSKGASPFPLTNFQDSLLTPPDDTSVRQTWTILRSAIDSHARRFYHTDSIYHSREQIRESIHEAGVVDDAQEAEDLATLLHSPRHRRMGLRICIARVMVSSIDFYSHPDETSLDPAVVELMRRFDELRPELGKGMGKQLPPHLWIFFSWGKRTRANKERGQPNPPPPPLQKKKPPSPPGA